MKKTDRQQMTEKTGDRTEGQKHGTTGDAGRTESEKFCVGSGRPLRSGAAVSCLCT